VSPAFLPAALLAKHRTHSRNGWRPAERLGNRLERSGVALPLDEAAKSPFVTALRDLGWAGGQNIIFEARDAAGVTA